MKIEFILDKDEAFTPLRIAEALESELLLETLSELSDHLRLMVKHGEDRRKRVINRPMTYK